MNKKKNEYVTPQMEIVMFEVEDVITASGDEIYGVDDLYEG